MRIQLEIDRQGSLYFLLNALIGAYNRRTDVLDKQADQRQLNQLTDRYRRMKTKLKAAVDNTKGE